MAMEAVTSLGVNLYGIRRGPEGLRAPASSLVGPVAPIRKAGDGASLERSRIELGPVSGRAGGNGRAFHAESQYIGTLLDVLA
jgi:hypothetical protein